MAAPKGVTRLFRTLSDETRFRLLRLLWREELTVNELSRITQLAQPRISNHLKILREEGLIIERREGSWRHYRVGIDQISEPAKSVWPLLEQSWKEDAHFAADDARLGEVVADRTDRPRGTFFDELAGQWDDIRASLFGDALGREILRTFLPEGLVVADIGTGTGYVLHVFGPRASRLIAIDNSEAMLQVAETKATAAGLNNVEFRLSDAQKTPLKAREADIITIIQVLHHFENPEEALRQLRLGLKKGGRFIISDFLDHEEAWLREQMHHRWSGFSREQICGWLERDGFRISSFDVLPGRIYESPEEHRLRIPDGFTLVAQLPP